MQPAETERTRNLRLQRKQTRLINQSTRHSTVLRRALNRTDTHPSIHPSGRDKRDRLKLRLRDKRGSRALCSANQKSRDSHRVRSASLGTDSCVTALFASTFAFSASAIARTHLHLPTHPSIHPSIYPPTYLPTIYLPLSSSLKQFAQFYTFM